MGTSVSSTGREVFDRVEAGSEDLTEVGICQGGFTPGFRHGRDPPAGEFIRRPSEHTRETRADMLCVPFHL